jgi:hypothetical protein
MSWKGKEASNKVNTKLSSRKEDVLRINMRSALAELVNIMDEIIVYYRLLVQLNCFIFVHKIAKILVAPEAVSRLSIRRDMNGNDFSSHSSEDNAAVAFFHQLNCITEGVIVGCTRLILPAIFGPMVVLIPRLILNLILRTHQNRSLNENSAQSKTTFLRFIVTVQQHASVFLQNCLNHDLESKRRLVDLMTEEFERVRRFLSNQTI